MLDTKDGTPDGLPVDEEAYLWVAAGDACRVSRHSPEGRNCCASASRACAAAPRPPLRADPFPAGPCHATTGRLCWWLGLLRVATMVLACLVMVPAFAADGFEDRCAALFDPARIVVVYADQAPERDDTLDVQALEGVAARRGDPRSRILGLTHADVSTQIQISARTVTSPTGRVCASPAVRVTLGYENFRVLVARNIGNACRRGVVEAHEREHVSIWRNYLRAGASLMAGQLRQDLGSPLFYDTMALADRNLSRHVQAVVAGHVRQLVASIVEANRQLDTPAAYQVEAGRLQACG